MRINQRAHWTPSRELIIWNRLRACDLRQQCEQSWETVGVVLSVQRQTSAVSLIGKAVSFENATHSPIYGSVVWHIPDPSLLLSPFVFLPRSPPPLHKQNFQKHPTAASISGKCRPLCPWHSIQPILQVHLHFEPAISSTAWCHSALSAEGPMFTKGVN